MSLHDAIAAANAVFLDLEGFAENVTHLPSGVVESGVVYPAIVDWSNDDGGGKRYRNHHSGSGGTGRVRDMVATVELAASIRIVGGGRDHFLVSDPQSGETVTLAVGDELGRDEGLQTWSLRKIGAREPSRSNYRGD